MTQYYEPEARALEEEANRSTDPAVQNQLWAEASLLGTVVELDEDGEEIWPNPVPPATAPWTITLCWTPEQNSGRVSVFPSRSPLFAVLGLLRAGEDPVSVSAEFGLTETEARVLSVLVNEIDSEDGL